MPFLAAGAAGGGAAGAGASGLAADALIASASTPSSTDPLNGSSQGSRDTTRAGAKLQDNASEQAAINRALDDADKRKPLDSTNVGTGAMGTVQGGSGANTSGNGFNAQGFVSALDPEAGSLYRILSTYYSNR